ncbi:MAG: apolipoprotein N-acyltransferase [Deltaproteobacteria bacterium]|nr:apolipoprotein N-acyltransferase [Deltaproteobacteria bacterium]
MPQSRSLLMALALTVLSVGLFALAFPPWNLRILAFVCLVPLFLALRSGGLGRALLLGGFWGILIGWAIASVFPASIARFYERPPWFGVIAGNVIFAVMAAGYYAVFAALDRTLVRSPRVFTPLLVAAAWVTMELARGRLFTGSAFFIGNPWGLLGYTHATGPMAQVASLAGVYGISFVLVAVNAGLAGWFAAWREPNASGHRAAGALALATLPALAVALGGSAALRAAPAATEGEGFREVAIAQGNLSVERRWRSDFYGKNLDVYLELTRRAVEQGTPLTVVWPESAMTFFVESAPSYRNAIAAVLRAGDVELLAGGPSVTTTVEGHPAPPFYNSVFLLDAEGEIRQRYDKEYLVPFSEYFPFARLDLMRRAIEGARTFEHGAADAPPLETRLGRAGILICNEAMLPEVARARVRAGAELLVSPSNDSWIAGRAFAAHMSAVVGLRAVEQRRYLIRASTSGPSAIVDPWGRVQVMTDAFTQDVLRGRVRPEQTLSGYARLGDSFAGACALAACLGCVRLRRGGARHTAGG